MLNYAQFLLKKISSLDLNQESFSNSILCLTQVSLVKPVIMPTRRQFLTANRDFPIRPPWSIAEAEFTQYCSGCGACVLICPEKILRLGSGNFPEVDFNRGECLFCQSCVDSCLEAVFDTKQTQAWNIKATINQQCLHYHHSECRRCEEGCETFAIRFVPKVNQIALPQINWQDCNGCGACVRYCPTQAIHMKRMVT